jgi:hypothetical protein
MPSIADRRREVGFDPGFVTRSPLLWPLARVAAPFAGADGWPAVESYAGAFAGPGPVRFVRATPRGRRPGARPLDAAYDARIVRDRAVPTRPRSWHDFLNALVWATFPLAKAALHARQHAAIAMQMAGATTRPVARTRELDALAFLDEGGVLRLETAAGPRCLVFGHGLYEGLVLGTGSLWARQIVLEPTPADLLGAADQALSEALAAPRQIWDPDALERVPLPEGPVPPDWAPAE